MNSFSRRPVIGYTWGDQAGIGPEVIESALASPDLPPDADYIPLGERINAIPGSPTPDTAKAAFDGLERAAVALRDGSIDAVVTAPVSKDMLHKVGFSWPGQTEFFAERLGVDNFAMCLSGDHLTVGLATIHVGLAEVPSLLCTPDLVRIGGLLARFCRDKGISRPHIAVAALNPHAGEQGAFGDEEARIIAPAVTELQALHPEAEFSGPEVPDTVYRDTMQGRFDAVLSPYHDQGLIPLKMLDFDTAVNITLGLPRPRISPDHGTAFGIAGKGLANPSSTLRAFMLAVRLARQTAL